MPNYEYQCTGCDHRFELWQSVGAPAPDCPQCQAAVKKVFHPPRVIFKGSGFYVTDLRAEREAKTKQATPEAKEAKPETKTDAPAASDKAADGAKPESAKSDAAPATAGTAARP